MEGPSTVKQDIIKKFEKMRNETDKFRFIKCWDIEDTGNSKCIARLARVGYFAVILTPNP